MWAVYRNTSRGQGFAPERSVVVELGQPLRSANFLELKPLANRLNSDLLALPPQQRSVWYSVENEILGQ